MAETGQKFKILIIDDDPDISHLMKLYLSSTGRYKVLLAGGGNIGMWLSSCKWHKPHLILLDIKMPGMDGFQVLKEIRAMPQTRYTPVIMFTAYDDPAFVVKAEGLYCDGYVLKSEGFEVIEAKIQEVLKKRGLL
ncbi:MAG: response regulator [Candidatus Omnitrophica bacterium]|nr:response regulator [Candidatus Omnitrophota bacterium]MDD5553433.1 response regulator [Candidatus Omnitrophota bacterium]